MSEQHYRVLNGVRSHLIIIVLATLLGAVMTHASDAGESSPATTKKNRLAAEKSPYLLQHADNPVDWYPWGEEAFEKARKEDKPIFLSIGYATCHWCHVMEHESFEDSDRRRPDERSLRQHQGRPRGTARYRSGLHDGVPDAHRFGRLAPDHHHDSGQGPVLRRNLLTARQPLWVASG